MATDGASRTQLLDRRAILQGMGVGFGLVLLEVLLFLTTPVASARAVTVLVFGLLIYGPTGAVTGWQVRHPSPSHATEALPASVQAMLAGLLLAPLHAFILLISNAGFAPGLPWFLIEAVLASLFASLAGGFAAFLRRREP